MEGEGQHNKVDKNVAWIPINQPRGINNTDDDNIRKEVLETDPSKEQHNKNRPQNQIMTLGDKPKEPQEMTKKYHGDDMVYF